MRTRVLVVFALVLLSELVFGSAGAQTVPWLESPPGQILVVDNNLQEAFSADDVNDPADVDNFVTRLLTRVDYVPDVVMLQEVVRASAEGVATRMSEQTGYPFSVVVGPDETVYPPGHEDREDQVVRETAILINTATMTATGPQGFIDTSYSAEDGIPGQRARTKQQAYSGLIEQQTGEAYAAMSIHYLPTQNWFDDNQVAWQYKAQWSDELAVFLEATFPEDATRLLVGDFNNRRCRTRDETRECETMPFWPVVTSTHGYTDALYSAGAEAEIGTLKRIDYIFGRTAFAAAASDLAYTEEDKADPATFYSDHRFLWGLTTSP
ncbi:MAG: hypothetical protein GEU71_13450 [Actinobacteria bacterium]|nr:hypothetical protein [Actinomycetota bacterium]